MIRALCSMEVEVGKDTMRGDDREGREDGTRVKGWNTISGGTWTGSSAGRMMRNGGFGDDTAHKIESIAGGMPLTLRS